MDADSNLFGEILNISFWNNEVPRTKNDVLRSLISIRDDISESIYVKEMLLNTCGFNIK